jgi:hypothetical protein
MQPDAAGAAIPGWLSANRKLAIPTGLLVVSDN